MRTWKIAGILAAVWVSSVTLFGQAAVEGALTHALSSATGTAMGGAANQLAGRVGRVSSAVSTHQSSTMKNVPRKVTPVRAAPAASPFGTSLIASIQGGEANPACASGGKTTQTAPAEKPGSSDPKVGNGCSVTTSKSTDDHPSVINLPATK